MADLNGVDGQLAGDVQAMINASHGRIWVNSGYRSVQEQTVLYNNAVKKYGAAGAGKWVAPPGHSNHNKGLAVDLGGDIALAHQLAPQFGIIFPMSWEPWHVELPGTRTGGNAQAYTQSPYGDANPTQDPNIDAKPETIAAQFSNALKQSSTMGEITGLGELTGPPSTPQPTTTGATQGGQGGQMTAGGATNPVSGGAVVSPADLYGKLIAQGLSPKMAAAGVAIASRESSFNAAAFNGNAGTGDQSYGLFQINKIGGMHPQFSSQSLQTVDGSVAAFASLAGGGDLSPWGGYKGVPWYHGVSQGNLQQAASLAGISVQDLMG